MLALAPLDDPKAIDAILHDEWVAPKLRQDGRAAGYTAHPLLTYIGAYIDGALVGLFIAARFTRWEVEVHAALLRPALPHSRALARLFLAQLFADADVMRATAYVMSTLPSAANWCRRVGFHDEGVRRDACRVDGRATDIVVLGMTRGDWDEGSRA